MRALLLAAALASTPALGDSADEAAWLERLTLPELARYDFEYQDSPGRLGFEEYDLGFPGDAQAMVSEAERRLEAEAATGRLLHQVAQGYALSDPQRALPRLRAAHEAYAAEVERSPDDLDLRMGFAHALELAIFLTREPAFLDEARAQLAAAARIAPEDWLVPFTDARICLAAMTTLALEAKVSRELTAAVRASSARARTLAPDRVEPLWLSLSLALVQQTVAIEGDGPEQFAAWTRGIEAAVLSLQAKIAEHVGAEEGARAITVAEGWWIVARLSRLRLQGIPAPERAELRAHVSALFDRLDAFELDQYHAAMLAKLGWMATVLLGLDGASPALLERAVTHGLEREVALGMALYRFRGEREVAEAFALELEAGALPQRARGALATYRYGTGELEAASAMLAGMTPTHATRAAEAIVALRRGERKEPRRALTALMLEGGRDGAVFHALGVALALDGRWELSVEQLEAALRCLEEPGPARATLKEVRARAADDRE